MLNKVFFQSKSGSRAHPSQTPAARCLIWDPCEQRPACTDGPHPPGAAAPSQISACGLACTLAGTDGARRGSFDRDKQAGSYHTETVDFYFNKTP